MKLVWVWVTHECLLLSFALKIAGPLSLLLVLMHPSLPLLAVTRICSSLSSFLFPLDSWSLRVGSPIQLSVLGVTCVWECACSLCVARSMCVHTCTRACDHSPGWCTCASSELPAVRTKDQVSDGIGLPQALAPLDSSSKFNLLQVWALIDCRLCPWTITLSQPTSMAPSKYFH